LFSVLVTALVTFTKLSYIEPFSLRRVKRSCHWAPLHFLLWRAIQVFIIHSFIRQYWDWWPPLVGLPFWHFPSHSTCPIHSSVGLYSEYCRWFWPLLGKKWQIMRSSPSCYQDCWHTGLLYASL